MTFTAETVHDGVGLDGSNSLRSLLILVRLGRVALGIVGDLDFALRFVVLEGNEILCRRLETLQGRSRSLGWHE